MDQRPNILLLMTDQHRGDCLGIEGHPVLQTPYLDYIAASGARFSKAYTACPVCVAARRTLMSGQTPAHHGVVSNYYTLLEGPTLPGELAKAGYQTYLTGKLHLWPVEATYGFEGWQRADGTGNSGENLNTDYSRYMRKVFPNIPNPGYVHGAAPNGWVVRPFHLDECYHHTNWCVDKALEFLEQRDTTRPFFLKVSFHKPHQPLTPPQYYYDKYMQMDLPQPYVGEWARVFDGPVRGLEPNAFRLCLDPIVMKQMRAAYYGCINHVDDQIGRLMLEIPQNTIVIFCADHGEMLGDHQWLRKNNAFEPSARIPFLIRFPKNYGIKSGQVIDAPVELMDIMPTILDAVGVPIPETVDGRSVLPLLRGETKWREYVHGEICNTSGMNTGMQYLTDGKRKYIWYPGLGLEHYFNLETDPNEMENLAESQEYAQEIEYFREVLIKELEDRPEQFTDGKKLLKLEGRTSPYLPHAERKI